MDGAPEPDSKNSLVSKRTMEIVVAVLLMGGGGVVMFDSWRVGIGWRIEGPQSGYFPFYVGLLIVLASVVTMVQAIFDRRSGEVSFVGKSQFKLVLSVLIPAVVFVVAVRYIGLYVSAAAFIAGFMTWLGHYGWRMTAPIAVGIPVFLFFVFELWFLLPLPKGPIEAWLGY